MADDRVLDNPVWAALTGPHAHLAVTHGRVARYPPDLSPFAAFADDATEEAWDDLAALVAPGESLALTGPDLPPPPRWRVRRFAGVQLVDTSMRAAALPEAVELGPDDIPDILDLVARTEPGPFAPRTIELGRYLGLRRDGVLVAMAGQRARVPGWVEISSVCTDVAYRGQGIATALVRAIAADIRAGGDTPFLHASATNTAAIRLYLNLGFTLRREVTFRSARLSSEFSLSTVEGA
jgi:ribosomal protein S18 acetylase RimI-like enzyme